MGVGLSRVRGDRRDEADERKGRGKPAINAR